MLIFLFACVSIQPNFGTHALEDCRRHNGLYRIDITYINQDLVVVCNDQTQIYHMNQYPYKHYE